MIEIDYACPSCGEETLSVSLDVILSGADEVMVECTSCGSTYETDLVFREETDAEE